MVIFVNHMPDNPWFWYTPSRFGLSDAAEIFVFLSGFASALAYGRCFEQAGLWLGLVRILHRCLQIYAAHLASFIVLALVCVIGNRWVPELDDIARLNIAYFFEATQPALYDLFTLNYVPNYFDILPMYLVMMAWLPAFWMLARVDFRLALSGSAGLYFAASYLGWELTADSASGRPWYFNPFNWQWLFFTGYGFGAGWLRVRRQAWLTMLCLGLVVASIPLSYEPIHRESLFWSELRQQLTPWLDKSHLGLLRWLHVLALAYLMRELGGWRPHWLQTLAPRAVIAMGQQSLPIFCCSMVLSYGCGIWLDKLGRGNWTHVAWVNLSGLALMLIAGHVLTWLDGKPWKVAQPMRSTDHEMPVTLHPGASHYRWSTQAVAFPLLIGLAILPIRRLNQAPVLAAATTADQVVQAQPIDEIQAVETELPETDDKLIDSQQRL